MNGNQTYGPSNKLLRHVATGIPVDLFSTTAAAWSNYLVCRTGPAELNVEIARRARDLGWKWTPYGDGFVRPGDRRVVTFEAEVFQFVGLPALAPWDRVALPAFTPA